MHRFVPAILFFSFFISCSGKNRIPANVLPPQKMEKVMWDMLRADEFVTSFVWQNDSNISRHKESIELYDQVFSIHKISREQFEKSLTYYREHPELLKRIIDTLSVTEHPYRKPVPAQLDRDSSAIQKSIVPIQ